MDDKNTKFIEHPPRKTPLMAYVVLFLVACLSVLSVILCLVMFTRDELLSAEVRNHKTRLDVLQREVNSLRAIGFARSLPIHRFPRADELLHRFRREINRSASYTSAHVTLGDIRRELRLLKASCQTSKWFCMQGPPGPKGRRGGRGRPGRRGPKGNKGPMGHPGKHGKQGMMGQQGLKGDKGDKGDSGLIGPLGPPGMKGEPGLSISAPSDVTITPPTLTITANQTAVLYCSASGNPKPQLSWEREGGSLPQRMIITREGRVEISRVGYSDSGTLTCLARNVLGSATKQVKLTVQGPPVFVSTPKILINAHARTNLTMTCRAIGNPPPAVTWSRIHQSLSRSRTKITNGVIKLSNLRPRDSGLYICRAINKFGVSRHVTDLYVSQQTVVSTTTPTTNWPTTTPLTPFLRDAKNCGSIVRFDPNTKDMNTNHSLPRGWTLCYIDKRDTAYHATQCKDLIKDLPGYSSAKALLSAGGNFGCWHGRTGANSGASYAGNNVMENSCRDNQQHNTRLNSWDRLTTTLGVCIRMP